MSKRKKAATAPKKERYDECRTTYPETIQYLTAYRLGMVKTRKRTDTKQQIKEFGLYKQSLAQQEADQLN